MKNSTRWRFYDKDPKDLSQLEKDKIGYYEKSSDDLRMMYVRGSFRDQGSVTMSFHNDSKHNHKGGDWKISPNQLMEFLKEIGVQFHFYTDRKHSYVAEIKLQPWSNWENALRKPAKPRKIDR